ncbi:ribosome-associated protein [Psychromicrobium silvestre]|uniref:Ribosome-associated protein n=1 Tax=Psychromicrobium silvestre TaxID=1645614 RepID=A0A7Y9LW23_9MICC|nr:RNA-binding S4 domain-containing protein [Psychromicrobium silvestre]NYE96626.1 ribosome-associated protein [Psychromicrobium silvestre]
MSPIDEITIRDETIRLGQLLKLANLADDGLQAKEFIENGLVKVDGEIETRRGRQLHSGSVVSLNGQSIRVVGS